MKIPENIFSKTKDEQKPSRESEKASARADDDGFHLPGGNVKQKDEKILKSAPQAYAAAYKEHYTSNDLKKAFDLYRGVIAAYPESQEATYSKKQIENIVAIIVPAQEVFDAQVNLAVIRFK